MNPIKFPYILEQYLYHFVRGYFDGDGHVNSKKYFVSFVSGWYNFMIALQEILEVQNYKLKFVDKEK